MPSLLQLQADLLAAQAVAIKTRGAQVANRVRLHPALGGGFDPAAASGLPEPEASRALRSRNQN